MNLPGGTNAEKIWDFCKSKDMSDCGAAAVLANLNAESGLNPKNLQDSYQTKLGFTDDSYTAAVDSGAYSREQFSKDCSGYGVAQWTFDTRKSALYDFVKLHGVSIGDLEVQLQFLHKELSESYPSVLSSLKSATSVDEATKTMMLKFERPYDQSITAQNKRVDMAQTYHTRFTTKIDKEVDSDMGYFNCTKGQVSKLSEHFNSTEFDCHGKSCCSNTLINQTLVEYLEKIRTHFGKPITISSGYRCSVHNKNVGGATKSRHAMGDAADIIVKGVAPREVAKYAESIGILGIGLYETSKDGHFVHIDTRTKKGFWYGQAQEKRTTFGGNNSTESVSKDQNTSAAVTTILDLGDKGDVVKELQRNLISLGYSCGPDGADGIFGSQTENAVMQFQAKNRIGVDGIVGYETFTAIKDALAKNVKRVKVTANVLNVRAGAGMNYKIVSAIRKDTVRELLDEKDGWGQISSPSGWISLQYTTII